VRLPVKWWLGVLAAASLSALGLWLLLGTLRPDDPTWERIRQTGILRVCTDPSWLPFEVFNPDTRQIEGFDADLAARLAARLAPDVRAAFVTVGFDSLYDALVADRCDAVISALPYDATRTQDASYSTSYFNAGLVLVTREGTEGISAVEELEGRVVGVEWGFVPEGRSRERLLLQRLGLRRYDTAGDALRSLQSGELEAALVDRISALGFLRQCPGLRIAGEPVTDVGYVVAVRPDSVLLLEEIDRALLELREDGTLEQLQGRWF
jgi:polar amino acid transport system substrate-binding protein